MTAQRAVIFGATGGIGAALVTQLENSGRYGLIHVGGRNLPSVKRPETVPFSFDLTDETSITQAARMIGESGPLDLAIVATGIVHCADQPMPLAKLRPLLASKGITLSSVRRDWDARFWPHATRGFFLFKERIPGLLQSLGLP